MADLTIEECEERINRVMGMGLALIDKALGRALRQTLIGPGRQGESTAERIISGVKGRYDSLSHDALLKAFADDPNVYKGHRTLVALLSSGELEQQPSRKQQITDEVARWEYRQHAVEVLGAAWGHAAGLGLTGDDLETETSIKPAQSSMLMFSEFLVLCHDDPRKAAMSLRTMIEGSGWGWE